MDFSEVIGNTLTVSVKHSCAKLNCTDALIIEELCSIFINCNKLIPRFCCVFTVCITCIIKRSILNKKLCGIYIFFNIECCSTAQTGDITFKVSGNISKRSRKIRNLLCEVCACDCRLRIKACCRIDICKCAFNYRRRISEQCCKRNLLKLSKNTLIV